MMLLVFLKSCFVNCKKGKEYQMIENSEGRTALGEVSHC
jgi:hypothetical protein